MKNTVFVLLLFFVVIGNVYATPSLRVASAEDNTSFRYFLALVARREKVAIVAEDEPLNTNLTEKSARELYKQLSGQDISASIRLLARSFDYFVEDTKPKKTRRVVYILKKRLTDRRDFLCVTLEEWSASLSNAATILQQFQPTANPSLIKDSASKQFAQSLTPWQLAAMSSEKGLSVADLSVTQLQYVHDFCLFFYTKRTLDNLIQRKSIIDNVLKQEAYVGWFPLNTRTLGIRVDKVSIPDGGSFFYAINKQSFFERRSPENVGRASKYLDKKNPSLVTAPSSKTLLEVTATLNAQEVKTAGTSAVFSVTPMLAGKRVSIAGNEYCTGSELFRALGQVYGLYVKRQGIVSTLERMRPMITVSLPLLRDAVVYSLPEPFVRAANATIADKRRSSDMYERLWIATAREALTSSLSIQMEKKSVESLLLTDVEQHDRIYLANLLMADTVETLRRFVLRDGTPEYIKNFQNVSLSGGLKPSTNGGVRFDLTINTVTLDGGMQPWAGYQFSNAADLGFTAE